MNVHIHRQMTTASDFPSGNEGHPKADRVLIVEDEIVVALFMEDILTGSGYRVAGLVSRLDEALRYDEADYDIAVLDVHLNGKSVFDFADRLAALGKAFVFATGYGARGIPERFATRPVLQKPFVSDDLKRALGKIAAAAA